MDAHLHAVLILAPPIATAYTAVRYYRGPLAFWRIVKGIVWALIGFVVVIVITSVLLYEIAPRAQLVIPPLCLGIVAASVERRKLERAEYRTAGLLCALIGLCGPLLALQYVCIIGRSARLDGEYKYTGNPTWTSRFPKRRARYNLDAVVLMLKDKATPATGPYPAGWLEDGGAIAAYQTDDRKYLQVRCRYRTNVVFSYWHSWFTGIFGVSHPETYGLWYPGGTLKDALPDLEWRLLAREHTATIRSLPYA